MTIFLIVSAIFLILVVVAISNRPRKAKSTKHLSEMPAVSVTVTGSLDRVSDGIDTGRLQKVGSNDWVINPKTTFPLTICGVSQSIAKEIKDILDSNLNRGIHEQIKSLAPIIARSNLRCREIDEYVNEIKPKYLRIIEEQKRASSEWPDASEKDREDLLETFKQKAMESIEIRPRADLGTILEGEPTDATFDDDLIDHFGFEALRLYFRYSDNLAKVRVVPANHRDRDGFEALVQKGLAIRGTEIPLASILDSLKLKEMNEMASELGAPAFKRKAQAIEYLESIKNIQETLGKKIAFRELFQLKPLPGEFSGIRVEEVSRSWKYYEEVAELLAHTYSMAAYASRWKESDASYVSGWEIAGAEYCCPHCQKLAAKTYSRKNFPQVPCHIGCSCSVHPVVS
ncbi:MAG: hypothetical protein HYZ11_13650 [Candidatus Tectomicrobia bacterium]|uniref:Uncharacterized protein n=1 Tax=Tectimicrobiota bacterium TaxID=2528274 RepID=A0A932I206_UNCTE|nr:hypothetical protein [Candidatus Tectomicrobia bacterium]